MIYRKLSLFLLLLLFFLFSLFPPPLLGKNTGNARVSLRILELWPRRDRLSRQTNIHSRLLRAFPVVPSGSIRPLRDLRPSLPRRVATWNGAPPPARPRPRRKGKRKTRWAGGLRLAQLFRRTCTTAQTTFSIVPVYRCFHFNTRIRLFVNFLPSLPFFLPPPFLRDESRSTRYTPQRICFDVSMNQ